MASKPAWASKITLATFVASVLFLSGCRFSEQLRSEWDALLVVLKGGSSPLAGKQNQDEGLQLSQEARNAQINGQLLSELYQVVLIREPASKDEFGSLQNALNQGGSLEGVYNGFTHSGLYRRLEVASGTAKSETIQAFAEILAELQRDLPQPTFFDLSSTRPLAVLGEATERVQEFSGGTGVSTPSAEAYATLFQKASFYTLKRVIGDEALKVVAAQRSSPEALAQWYGKWVVRMAEKKVDFGLPARNRGDEAFHREWAKTNSQDRLNWEVLNRVHRVLNEAERSKSVTSPSAQSGTEPIQAGAAR